MLITEFINLTENNINYDQYEKVEKLYMKSNLDKNIFCHQYKKIFEIMDKSFEALLINDVKLNIENEHRSLEKLNILIHKKTYKYLKTIIKILN